MSAKIDFSTNILEIKGGKNLPLKLSPGGHLLLEIRPAKHPLIKSSAFTPAYVQESVDVASEEDNEEPIIPCEPTRKKELSMGGYLENPQAIGTCISFFSHLMHRAGGVFPISRFWML